MPEEEREAGQARREDIGRLALAKAMSEKPVEILPPREFWRDIEERGELLNDATISVTCGIGESGGGERVVESDYGVGHVELRIRDSGRGSVPQHKLAPTGSADERAGRATPPGCRRLHP